MVKIEHRRTCVFQIAYHVVWCCKYRKEVLVGEVRNSVAELTQNICLEKGYSVLSLEVQPDHLHLFLSIPPRHSVATAVKILKGTIARKLFVRFPELKKELLYGHLWSPSYYVGTAGNVSATTIQSYIERSGHIASRR